jgi:hypothetical protein
MNMLNTAFTMTEALMCLKTNSHNGTYFVKYSGYVAKNASFDENTGLFTLAYPAVPVLLKCWVTVTDLTVPSPITYTLRIRDGSLSGTILTEASMVQTVAEQSIMMFTTVIVQNVAVLAPTFYVSSSFTEVLDDIFQRFSFHTQMLIEAL